MDNKKTILIIDDDVHIRRILEIKIKLSGYDTLTAKNGKQGLEIIKNQKPDAVISDLNMPRLDGKELCIMTNPLKKDRPFFTIIITARIDPHEQKWIDEMQDTIFMEKPFSPSKIIEALAQYFEKTNS
ncbi:MAG: response regulator [Desulfobacula sp.]|uniref:response regulator n=1 Tax=Desulfobacula sp. TaxID=2593537 RepID=UPI001DDA689E|nr:response regulator [Desulfobacula sp.]MBT3484075.1 response regulator [Desulfobacula sp.]MBT3805207.1 response regulator [Desulfobacula sp.]MBT4024540.1 response regulator [Desulfobacula sp.]MBT4199856.1 response regulator [Desulfobacula sp.]